MVLHISICIDNNYVYPAKALINSICRKTNNQVHFHIIKDGQFLNENEDLLSKHLLEKQVNSSFYTIKNDIIKKFPIKQEGQPFHITSSAYYRLFLPEILPQYIDKVLYLDVDIIAWNDISRIWELDLSQYAVGVVPDMDEGNLNTYRRLQYPPSKGYFNSGVLLINLKYWREHNLVKSFLDFWTNHPERILYHDQDILNYVLRDVKLNMPIKCNVQTAALYKVVNISWEYDKQLKEALESPILIHYTTSEKPWIKGCKHPWKHIWYKFIQERIPRKLSRKVKSRKLTLYARVRNLLIKMNILESNQTFKENIRLF